MSASEVIAFEDRSRRAEPSRSTSAVTALIDYGLAAWPVDVGRVRNALVQRCRARTNRLQAGEVAEGAGGIEPRSRREHCFGIVTASLAPRAKSETVEAAKERSIIDPSPREHAIKVGRQRCLANRDAGLVELGGWAWPTSVEGDQPEVSPRIDAPVVDGERPFEYSDGLAVKAGVMQFCCFDDRVAVPVVHSNGFGSISRHAWIPIRQSGRCDEVVRRCWACAVPGWRRHHPPQAHNVMHATERTTGDRVLERCIRADGCN